VTRERRRRLVVLAALVAVAAAGSGYVYGFIAAHRLRQALAGRIELSGATVELGEVTTSIGYFSASARLRDSRILFDGGTIVVPAATLRPAVGALAGTADSARLTLDQLPRLEILFETVTYRLAGGEGAPDGGRAEARVTAATVRAENDAVRATARSFSLAGDRKDHERWDGLALSAEALQIAARGRPGAVLGAAKASWSERLSPRGQRRLGIAIETAADAVRLETADPRSGRGEIARLALKAAVEIDGDRRTTLWGALRELAASPDPLPVHAQRLNPVISTAAGAVGELAMTGADSTVKVGEGAFEYRERPVDQRVEKTGTLRVARVESSGGSARVSLAEVRATSESITSPAHERALLAQLPPRAVTTPGPELLAALIDYVSTSTGTTRVTFKDLVVREGAAGTPLTFPDGGLDIDAGFRDGVGAFAFAPRVTLTKLDGLEGRLPITLPVDRLDTRLKLFARNVRLEEVRRLVTGAPPPQGDWSRMANEVFRALAASKPGVGVECALDAEGGPGIALKASLDLDQPIPPGFRVDRHVAAGGGSLARALLDVGSLRLRLDVTRSRRLVDLLDAALGPGAGEAWLARGQGFLVRSGDDLAADLTVRGGRAELNGKPSPQLDALLARPPTR
jgi:hypothetical protein